MLLLLLTFHMMSGYSVPQWDNDMEEKAISINIDMLK